jgi:hypothetical protein
MTPTTHSSLITSHRFRCTHVSIIRICKKENLRSRWGLQYYPHLGIKLKTKKLETKFEFALVCAQNTKNLFTTKIFNKRKPKTKKCQIKHSSMRNSQTKYWCFTSYEAEKPPYLDSMTYLIVGHETCPDTGNKNCQCSCELKSKQRARESLRPELRDLSPADALNY